MPKFIIDCTATATIRERWEVEAATEKEARDVIEQGSIDDATPPLLLEEAVMGDERDRIITSIEQIEMVKLRFRPQAWQNDYAVDVDPLGSVWWETRKDMFLLAFPTPMYFAGAHDERDSLARDDEAPSWVQKWQGPFEVELAPGENPWGAQA